MPLDAIKKQLGLDSLILLLALVQTGWLVWYYFTGLGGPQELVARVMPIALALQILFMYRQGPFYKWLPPAANALLRVQGPAGCVQVQPVPLMAVAVRPVGTLSVTVTVPVVGPVPALEAVIV